MVGDAAIAQILLTAGADVDTSLRPNMMPTPLILAAELGLADVVRVLLRANASLLPTLRGMTALEAALDPAVRRLLLQATGAKSDPRVRAQQQRKSRGKGGAALASDDAYDDDDADYAEGGGLPSAMTVAVVLALLCTALGLARHCMQGTASPQRERKAGRRGKAASDSDGSEARGKATRTEAKAVATPAAEAKRAADAKRVAEAKRAAEKAVAKEEQKLRRRRGPEAAGEGGEARGAPACGAEDFTRQREEPVRREAEAVQEALLESIAASRAAAVPSGTDAAAGLRAIEAAAEAKAVAAAAAKPVAAAAKPAAAAAAAAAKPVAAAAKPVAAAPKPVAAAAKPVAAAAKPVAAKSETKVKAAKEGDESVKAKAPHAKAEGATAVADANVGAAAAEVAGGAAPHVVERQRVQMERLARAARGGTAAATAAPAVEETFEVVDKNEARRKRKEEAEGRQTQERQAEAEVRRKAEEERERRRREQLEVEVAQRKAAVAAAAVAAASKAAARPGAPPPKSQQQQPTSVRNGGANANANANGHAHGSGARNGGPAERGQAFSVVAGGRPDAASPAAAPSHEEVELQLALALSRSLADDDAEPSGIEHSSMQQQEAQQEQLLHALLNSSHELTPPHHAPPHAPQPAAWGPPNATGAFGQAPAPMPLSMPPPQQPMLQQPPQLPQGWQAQLPQQALLSRSSLEKFAQLPSLLPTQPASPHAAGLARYAHAPALHAGSWGAPQPGAEATWGAPTGPAADGAQPAGGAQWGAPPVGCVGGGWPSQGAGALPAGLPAGLPARLPQSAGLPPPGDFAGGLPPPGDLAVRQAQALIAAMPRGLPPPRAHPPGVLSHMRSSSPVGGEPVGSDREPAGAPLEGIAGGKGVADDAPLVGDKARAA
jgi:hypothetical protein